MAPEAELLCTPTRKKKEGEKKRMYRFYVCEEGQKKKKKKDAKSCLVWLFSKRKYNE